jgi:hypothetical protein
LSSCRQSIFFPKIKLSDGVRFFRTTLDKGVLMAAEAFYEGFYDALRDDVQACGGGKVVGHWFWPEKSVEAARARLADALNPERRERLSDEQERLIMRRAREARGFSAAICFLCDDTGFERPKALPPKDRLKVLSATIEEFARDSGMRVVK